MTLPRGPLKLRIWLLSRKGISKPDRPAFLLCLGCRESALEWEAMRGNSWHDVWEQLAWCLVTERWAEFWSLPHSESFQSSERDKGGNKNKTARTCYFIHMISLTFHGILWGSWRYSHFIEEATGVMKMISFPSIAQLDSKPDPLPKSLFSWSHQANFLKMDNVRRSIDQYLLFFNI